jgi:hypothetical protein
MLLLARMRCVVGVAMASVPVLLRSSTKWHGMAWHGMGWLR